MRDRESVCEWQGLARTVCYRQIPKLIHSAVPRTQTKHMALRGLLAYVNEIAVAREDVKHGRNWRGVALLRLTLLTSPLWQKGTFDRQPAQQKLVRQCLHKVFRTTD